MKDGYYLIQSTVLIGVIFKNRIIQGFDCPTWTYAMHRYNNNNAFDFSQLHYTMSSRFGEYWTSCLDDHYSSSKCLYLELGHFIIWWV